MAIFYRKIEKNTYLYDEKDAINLDSLSDYDKNLYCPLVIDTEFTGLKRHGVTVQISDIKEEKPIIFVHPDLENYALNNGLTLRHKVLKEQFFPIDYLKLLGLDIDFSVRKKTNLNNKEVINYDIKTYQKISRNGKLKELPVIQFDIYAHFALAELLMLGIEDVKESLIEYAKIDKKSKKDKNKPRYFEMTKRLRTVTSGKNNSNDYVEMPWEIYLNNKTYRVRLRIIDTSALHGVASYKNLCETVGIKLEYKENLLQSDKENMIETYFNKPEDFDNYSLGDLKVYEILEKNDGLFLKVYQSLGIEKYFKPSNLTIGSTIKNLFKAVLYNHFDISEDDKEGQKRLIEQCHWASASILKKKTNSTECLLAKINGGRCRNNRPLTTFLNGSIVDIDITSAYGNGLRHLIYPLGKPVIESYEINNVKDYNGYLTLREWLKHRKYGKKNNELLEGLWCVYVSNKQNEDGSYKTLSYAQDFIVSWFDFKYEEIADMGSDCDTFETALDINPKTGKVKILNNQVINGVITSDILDIILNVCSPQQRNELLDNLYVYVACYYPKYSQVNTLEDLLNAWQKWDDKNTTVSKKVSKRHKLPSGQIIKIINEPTYWLGLPLGKLIVDNLIGWRKYYQAKDGRKCSMQTLFKLSGNTLFGIFCSPYFDISNTVLGNNITAKCRVMAWTMEKGFNMVQTITDGGQFDLNKVIYPINDKRSVTAISVTNLYQEKCVGIKNLIEKPLDDCDNITHFYDENDRYKDEKTGKTYPKIKLVLSKDGKEETINDSAKWINQKSIEHLKKHFKLSILHNEYSELKVNIEQSLIENKPVIYYQNNIGLYSLEIKDIYDSACFHGTANYYMENKNNSVLAMRSYETNRKHFTFELSDNGDYIETFFYNENIPSQYFLEQLRTNKTVKRSRPFKKLGILKLNEFKKDCNSDNPRYISKGLLCGDSIEKFGVLRELSLSQFTFKTMSQLLAIEKESTRNKTKYEQSYEGYFINEDGTLNYFEMIKTIDSLISIGTMSFNNALDKDRHRMRDLNFVHPEKEMCDLLRKNFVMNDNLSMNSEKYEEMGIEETAREDIENIESDLDF